MKMNQNTKDHLFSAGIGILGAGIGAGIAAGIAILGTIAAVGVVAGPMVGVAVVIGVLGGFAGVGVASAVSAAVLGAGATGGIAVSTLANKDDVCSKQVKKFRPLSAILAGALASTFALAAVLKTNDAPSAPVADQAPPSQQSSIQQLSFQDTAKAHGLTYEA